MALLLEELRRNKGVEASVFGGFATPLIKTHDQLEVGDVVERVETGELFKFVELDPFDHPVLAVLESPALCDLVRDPPPEGRYRLIARLYPSETEAEKGDGR